MRRPGVVSVLLCLALALGGCDALGLGGEGNVFSLSVGDCFDDASDLTEEVSDVPIVDCDEPHDNEVFHVFDVDDGAYPGREALRTQAQETCLPVFEEYVGRDYASSELDIFPITPTEGSWSDGDREVICALYDLDLEKLEGSMQDSGV